MRRPSLAVMLIVALCLSAATAPPAATAAQRIPARVALVIDGQGADSLLLPPLIRTEVEQVLGGEFDVVVAPDDRFRADETIAGVTAALDRALEAPDIDLVICTGVLGSMVATGRRDLPRPVIAAVAISTAVQGLPLTPAGTSGVPQLHYVLDGRLLEDDLAALIKVAGPMRRVALLGSEPMLLALPGVTPGLGFPLGGDSEGIICSAGLDAATALANLPADIDGVVIAGLAGYREVEAALLIDGLIARGLPHVAVVGQSMVERGALCGTTSRDWLQRLSRRVALNTRKIMAGTQAADLPVALPRTGALFINMQTARQLEVYPPFSVTVDAVLIDADRRPGRLIDLWQAMDEATAANKDLVAAAARLEAGRQELAIARARLLPQIELSAVGTVLDEDRALAAGRPSERSVTAGVDATQVIFSDAAWTGYTVQKQLQAQREAAYDQDRLDVALAAASAYFQVLRAETMERLQRGNLELSRENLDRARVRVRLGEASRAEEYRWQAKIADEKSRLIDAIAERNVVEMELNRVLNRPLEESVRLAEPDLDGQLSLLLDPRLERFLADAWHLARLREFGADFARRASPELRQLTAALAAQERVLTGNKRSFFLPDVALSLGWARYLAEEGAGSDGRPSAFPDDTDWSASLAVSLPLFQGGQRFAEARQAGSDVVRLRAELAAAGERIEQRIRTAVHRTSASKAGIDLSREAATASHLNFDLVSDAYSRGAVDLITLLDAQNANLNSDLAAADAVYQFLLDLMELERSVGAFTHFATADEREAWLAELESWFDQQP